MSKVLDTGTMSIIFDIMSSKPVIAEEPVGLSFREKSLWVELVSMIAIYGAYFLRAFAIGDGQPWRVGALFAGAVVATIIVHSVVHAALALHKQPEHADERDRAIARRATQIAYFVLMTGVWGALGVAVLQAGAFWCAHAALLAVMIAEATRCAVELVLYRRGA